MATATIKTLAAPSLTNTGGAAGPRAQIRRSFFRIPTSVHAGFTLIEVMVVITIIAAVIAVAAPKMFDTKAKIKGAVRRIAVLPREIHNAARLYNSTMRLVLSMPEDPSKEHSYWVESAPGNVVLLSEDQEKEQERLTELQRDKSEQKNNGFSTDPRVMKNPISLPKGLYFVDIEYANRLSAISSGTAYVHFFPQGLVEEALIHISDKKTLNWSIRINPITGKVDLFDHKVSIKELRGSQ